jgi:exonuclease SbcD
LVELGADGPAHVEQVPAPVHRPLSLLRGELRALLADPAHAAAEGSFVSVTLTDAARPEAAMDRLRTRFPHTLVLTWEPALMAAAARDYRQRLVGRSDLDLAVDFVSHVRGTAAGATEAQLLEQAFEAVRIGTDGEQSRPERVVA